MFFKVATVAAATALSFTLLFAPMADAKSGSSGGGRSGGFSSSARSSFSSSSKSFSSSSKSSPTKSFSSSSSFSKPSVTYKPSTRVFSGNFNYNKATSSIRFKPLPSIPRTYGTYSGRYYSAPRDSGISANNLMFYLALDSMSDAAMMTVLANKDSSYEEWKKEAMASNDKELNDRIAQLEAKLATMNATAVNATFVDPEIQAKLNEGVNGANMMDVFQVPDESGDEMSTEDFELWLEVIGIVVGVIALYVIYVSWAGSYRRRRW